MRLGRAASQASLPLSLTVNELPRLLSFSPKLHTGLSRLICLRLGRCGFERPESHDVVRRETRPFASRSLPVITLRAAR
jgi:hypothetical protein